jgi:hypothetical protein
MSDDNAMLRERARRMVVSPGGLDRTMEKVERRLRWRRLRVALAASVLTMSSLGLLVMTFSSTEPRGGEDAAAGDGSERIVELPGSPTSVAADRTGVWIAVSGGHSNGDVLQVSSSDLRITSIISDVDLGLPGARSVQVSDGDVWVAVPTSTEGEGAPTAGAVVRLAADRARVQVSIPLMNVTPLLVAVGSDAVWVAGSDSSGDGTLVRIDPATNDVVASIELPYVPRAIAVSDEGVWTVGDGQPTDGALSRVDPATNAVIANIAINQIPSDVVVFGGAAWVVGSDDDLSGVLSSIKLGN